jgi:hypothetical protein
MNNYDIIRHLLLLFLIVTFYLYLTDDDIELFTKKEVINDNKFQLKPINKSTVSPEYKKIRDTEDEKQDSSNSGLIEERVPVEKIMEWIDSGHFLDDGNSDVSILHNKCSPLCCKKQKYVPAELQPNPDSDPELTKEILNGKYIHSNFRCIDKSIVPDYYGGSSCLCVPLKKTNIYNENEETTESPEPVEI